VIKLSKGVEKKLAAMGQTFNQLGEKYKDRTLNEAVSKDPGCQKLRKSRG
jgi:hypothetical protein